VYNVGGVVGVFFFFFFGVCFFFVLVKIFFFFFFFFFFFLFGSTRSRIDANLDSTYILFTITINIYIYM